MTAGSRRKVWYKDGLRFQCQRCGGCCSGAPGYVQMTADEAQVMARELGLELEEFRQRYIRTELSPSWYLKEVPSEYGLDCVMLIRDPEPPHLTSCRVHTCRPRQCQSWPFWPSNLSEQKAWAAQARQCPGFDQGPLFSAGQIESICTDNGLCIDE